MNYILCIDQSTSATKALLFDLQGRVVDKESESHRQYYPKPGWVEHDAEEIWTNTLLVLTRLIERNREIEPEILRLSITNQRETVVVFDRKTGKPLHRAIVWQCRRGDEICRILRKDKGCESDVRQKTGLKIDTYFSASKLAWILREEPDIASRIRDGSALIGTIDSYLIYRLTNQQVFATDHTNACRTLLFNINSLEWDEELLGLFGIPRNALPEVRESTAGFGDTGLGGVLKKRLKISGVMGDSQASLFAQRCFKPGMVKVTFGSGSSVLLNIGNQLKLTESGAVTTLAWVMHGQPTFAFEGLINYSSATILWLKDQLHLIEDPAETEDLATRIPDNGGVYLIPAFSGLSAPYWDSDARAAIVGMTAHSGRNHIVRAALESIAYQLKDVLEEMEEDAGISLSFIRADGGPTANRFLMQFTSDLVGLELQVADLPECSPLGASLCAAIGAGIYSSLDELEDLRHPFVKYRRKMEPELADRYYSGWKQAVKRVLV